MGECIEDLVEEYEPEDPLTKAGRIYSELHEYGEKAANAAHQHSQISYDKDSSRSFGSEFVRDESMTDFEALCDLKFYSFHLSNAWSEAQEYFMFDFRNEFYHELEFQEDEDTTHAEDAFLDLQEKYDELEEDLKKLDRVLDEDVPGIRPPSSSFEENHAFEPVRQHPASAD